MSVEAFYVGGEWREPQGSARVDVIDSFTEKVVAKSPVATDAEVDAAVSAARKALPKWSAVSLKERLEKICHLRAMIEANTEELAQGMTGETGMPIRTSRKLQVGLPLQAIDGYLEAADRMVWSDRVGAP